MATIQYTSIDLLKNNVWNQCGVFQKATPLGLIIKTIIVVSFAVVHIKVFKKETTFTELQVTFSKAAISTCGGKWI